MQRIRPKFSEQVIHVMSRAVEGKTLFQTHEEYAYFTSLLSISIQKYKLRLLEWVLMPNHWHLLLWPKTNYQVPECMRWLKSTHAKSIRQRTGTVGKGAVYQGRYRSTFIEPGLSLNRLRNYLAMNPVKATLINHPAAWKWGSAARLLHPNNIADIDLSKGPLPFPNNMRHILLDPMYLNPEQKIVLENALRKENPYGSPNWQATICDTYDVPLRAGAIGRPRKH
ncbi:MAG: transposase [Planctomycetes bacterium]|nr:transposase [Planctomycetota bacterium]